MYHRGARNLSASPNSGKVTKPLRFLVPTFLRFVVALLIREAYGVLNPNGSVWAYFSIDYITQPANL